ncbi:conserved Plasmodium protein, unknown function [Plasmodium gallinaceum]|uniref:Uncharacterized protein n=1 Tax=Plasmodium gallinaceum TaxID=5849 RepID=A0A1J1GXK1_PLAGA|nr:conserved Plasmodium protein, unknown function [Plasmodium gallinaceum]CRG97215.1 conserved Plasmodium protein, unknown function [Plasmodium gallinaceum]
MILNGNYLLGIENSTNKNHIDMTNISSRGKNTVNKEFNSKMDSLIELTENSRNKISLLESQNKTKKKEVEGEYIFLKKIGDVCKRSCDYYYETNINFLESCGNFNILFKTFSNSLVMINKKNEDAEKTKEILKKYEEKELLYMKEKEEIYEKIKKELQESVNHINFMNNESVNMTNKIKEIDYQINQHKEAFESFNILTNLNYEKINLLENDLKKLGDEKDSIINNIDENKESINICRQNLINQKSELDEKNDKLILKEKELKFQKENLIIKKNELVSNNLRIKSQLQFLENQISSQEYYLNVINSGLNNTLNTKKELEENEENIETEINNLLIMIEKIDEEKRKENDKFNELHIKLDELRNGLKTKEEELIGLKNEEKILNDQIENEKKKLNKNMLNDLTKEKNIIEEEITNYKEEIKNLILNEKNKIDINGIDIDVNYKENQNLLSNLEDILEKMKIKIKEEQDEQWKKDREIQNINAKICELIEKLDEEKKKKNEIDIFINSKKEELNELKNKEKDSEKHLLDIKGEMKKLEFSYKKENDEIKETKKILKEICKKTESEIMQLHKDYDEKTKNLYSSKNYKIDINSVEKKKMKEEIDEYFEKIKKEYELKKKEFEKDEKGKNDEENKQLDEELKKKDDLINYYKELLSKHKDNESDKKYLEDDKGNEIQNNNSKKKEYIKSYQKNNTYNNLNKYKLYTMSDQYKFGYFDVTSPGVIRKSIKIQNRSVKSPHITRLLEKIKNRKECQTLIGSKKTSLYQVNSNNNNNNSNKIFSKIKKSKNNNSFDLFQHL